MEIAKRRKKRALEASERECQELEAVKKRLTAITERTTPLCSEGCCQELAFGGEQNDDVATAKRPREEEVVEIENGKAKQRVALERQFAEAERRLKRHKAEAEEASKRVMVAAAMSGGRMDRQYPHYWNLDISTEEDQTSYPEIHDPNLEGYFKDL
eukprot:1521819-Rhodomonas_salina.1